MSNTWEDELRSEVFAEECEPDEVCEQHDPPKKKSFGGVFLTTLVVLMGVIIAFALYQKDPNFFGKLWTKDAPVAEQPTGNTAPPPGPATPPVVRPPVDNSQQLAEIMAELRRLKAAQGELKSEMDVLGKKVKIQGDRIIILGIIQNDNAMGTRNGDRDPLYLNPDWTIPREPRYLQPTGEDLDFIRKNVKPQ